MRNRYLVFGLASFIAIAMAVPALGGPSNPIASSSANALKVAKKAKQKANAAQSTADTALAAANAADAKAGNAQTSANTAQTAANNALAAANTKFDTMSRVEGATSSSDEANKTVSADCNPSGIGGPPFATGGGWVHGGTGSDDATASLNSSFYNDTWIVVSEDIGQSAGNWTSTANVMCIAP